jgi:hypothetical protein
MIKYAFLACLSFNFYITGFSQSLKPGFDKQEYVELMKVSAQFGDSGYAARIRPDEGYQLVYRSPEMGLDNRWHLWMSPSGIPIISIRGTTLSDTSWTANFYAAMVPAKGSMQINSAENISYNVGEHPHSAVHVGWLTGMLVLSRDILPRFDSLYQRGKKDFYIVGHSQGGAIAFLLTAYLRQMQKQGSIKNDVKFKTYCSAGPKPGNLYFAYEYESLTQNGWAYNVTNTEDWVPQSFFSVQTVNDFVDINPFENAQTFIKGRRLPSRWVLNYAYGRLTKPAKKAQRNYRKYLGKYVERSVKKMMPGYVPPPYVATGDYVRTGAQVILYPAADYYAKFPQDKKLTFVNHLHDAYIYLAQQLDDK